MKAVLNFTAAFAPLVEAGTKKHTIRAKRADQRDPKVGDELRLYTGLRTKQTRLLRSAYCFYVVPICIQYLIKQMYENGVLIEEPCTLIWVNHTLFGDDEADALARADGFDNSASLAKFFENSEGLPFDGLLIGWGIPAYAGGHHG